MILSHDAYFELHTQNALTLFACPCFFFIFKCLNMIVEGSVMVSLGHDTWTSFKVRFTTLNNISNTFISHSSCYHLCIMANSKHVYFWLIVVLLFICEHGFIPVRQGWCRRKRRICGGEAVRPEHQRFSHIQFAFIVGHFLKCDIVDVCIYQFIVCILTDKLYFLSSVNDCDYIQLSLRVRRNIFTYYVLVHTSLPSVNHWRKTDWGDIRKTHI